MSDIFNYEHPFVTTDAVVFTVNTVPADSYRKLPEVQLKILLYKRATEPYADKWCLPGGFLNIDEIPEDNIKRKLLEKSNVENCFLEQLYTFSNIKRDPRARVISLSYIGLMNESESQKFDSSSTWFAIKQNGEQLSFVGDTETIDESDLGFDHYMIIKTALERLKSKIQYSDIIFNLLPNEFTLTELQNIYEIIQNKKESIANFRRKTGHLVEETENYSSEKGHRPAQLFTRRNLL
ncbi:MAG: NUDIX hydrolase [Firmicutes bacterium]|nr:NUDIX hydrolase [Bacillota bacterium]